MGFIKIKNHCNSKGTTKKMKRQSQNRRKYLQITLSYKGLDPKYVRTLTTK